MFLERQRNNNGNIKRNLKDGEIGMPTGGGKYTMFCYSRVPSKGVTAVVICDTITGIDRGSGTKGLRGCGLNVCYINSKMKDNCLSG